MYLIFLNKPPTYTVYIIISTFYTLNTTLVSIIYELIIIDGVQLLILYFSNQATPVIICWLSFS